MPKKSFKGLVIYEQMDGENCVRIPLSGKHGQGKYCRMDQWDWQRYQDNLYSPHMRLNSSGNVVTGHRQSAEGRSCDTTVARIIMGGKKGHRIKYLSGDRLDLRRKNLELVRGKSGGTLRPNVPDPRINRRENTNPDALYAVEELKGEDYTITKMQLLTDGQEWSADWKLEQWLQNYDWEPDSEPMTGRGKKKRAA